MEFPCFSYSNLYTANEKQREKLACIRIYCSQRINNITNRRYNRPNSIKIYVYCFECWASAKKRSLANSRESALKSVFSISTKIKCIQPAHERSATKTSKRPPNSIWETSVSLFVFTKCLNTVRRNTYYGKRNNYKSGNLTYVSCSMQ